jgi:FkbM family methyltransferase
MTADAAVAVDPVEAGVPTQSGGGPLLPALAALFVSRGRSFVRWYVPVIRNWWAVAPVVLLPQSHTRLIFSNGQVLDCTSRRDWHRIQTTARDALLRSRCGLRREDAESSGSFRRRVLRLGYRGQTLRFIVEGDEAEVVYQLAETFLFGEYNQLEVKGRDVVDIGAHFGDTAIAFAAQGARRVWAFEAAEGICDRARRNVALNAFHDRVEVIHGLCGNSDGTTRIREPGRTPGSWSPQAAADGTLVRKYSLSTVAARYVQPGAILKVDCEGCEYALLDCPDSALASFDFVAMEYHYGPGPLVRRLRRAGYSEVRATTPILGWSEGGRPDMRVGLIFARRNE